MFRLGKIKTFSRKHWIDALTLAGLTVGVLALFALIFYNVVPIKLADIKVPVATDKSSYYPSQQVGGIFFGETFYDGNVKILREVFCTHYKGVIKPPADAADGDFFDTQAKPRKLDGATVPIGNLPEDVPVGQNCVIRFTNVYNIQTPFGVRHEEYQYYTQNFAIITKERRQLLDCEASGKKTEDCLNLTVNSDQDADRENLGSDNLVGGGSDENNQTNTSKSTTNTKPDTTPPPQTTQPDTGENEPVTPPQECSVDVLFLHLFCR